MNRLYNTPFKDLLPGSISNDFTIDASAHAIDAELVAVTLSTSNLLLYARLLHTAGYPRPAPLVPALARTVEAAGGLKPLDTEALEQLAWQLHVDFRDVAKTDKDLAVMIVESIPWHRIKGTPAAVERALAMYGVVALVDESGRGKNWAVYELELKDVPGGTLPNIVRVANETAPARCRLRRVYGGYDRRPIILDVGPPLDEGFLDDDSGVWDEETGVKESFGHTLSLQAETDLTEHFPIAFTTANPFRAFYIDKPILDRWRLDDPTVKSHGIVGAALISLMSHGIYNEKYTWTGEWDHRRWSGTFYPTTAVFPRRKIHYHRSVSKSQLVLDFCHLDDPTVRMDRQVCTLIDLPMRLDSGKLDTDAKGIGKREFYVDELFLTTLSHQAVRHSTQSGTALFHGRGIRASGSTQAMGVSIYEERIETQGFVALRREYSRPDGTEWVGPWSHRRWGAKNIPLKVTHEGDTI